MLVQLWNDANQACFIPGSPPLSATDDNGKTVSIKYEALSQSSSPTPVVIDPRDSAYNGNYALIDMGAGDGDMCSSGSQTVTLRSITIDLGQFGQVTLQLDNQNDGPICGPITANHTIYEAPE